MPKGWLCCTLWFGVELSHEPFFVPIDVSVIKVLEVLESEFAAYMGFSSTFVCH